VCEWKEIVEAFAHAIARLEKAAHPSLERLDRGARRDVAKEVLPDDRLALEVREPGLVLVVAADRAVGIDHDRPEG